MKVRKGDIVAFRLRESDRTCWRIGLVNAATRNGKVKEVFSNGAAQKTISKSVIIEKVLYIPRNQVRADDLLIEAEAQEWETLAECEQFVAGFIVSPPP